MNETEVVDLKESIVVKKTLRLPVDAAFELAYKLTGRKFCEEDIQKVGHFSFKSLFYYKCIIIGTSS
jgi:hypothetical protein